MGTYFGGVIVFVAIAYATICITSYFGRIATALEKIADKE